MLSIILHLRATIMSECDPSVMSDTPGPCDQAVWTGNSGQDPCVVTEAPAPADPGLLRQQSRSERYYWVIMIIVV